MKELYKSDFEKRRQISERVQNAIGFESLSRSAGGVALLEQVQTTHHNDLELPHNIVLGEE